jgi:membrane protease YdiL (CAAX protease family)
METAGPETRIVSGLRASTGDLRLAASVILYVLAFLVIALGPSRLVHSTLNFFSPQGSLVYGLAFSFLVATLTALFRRLERLPHPLGLTGRLWSARALGAGMVLGAFACAMVVFVQWAFGYVVVGGLQTGRGPGSVFLASLARNPGIAFGEELAFRGQILGRLSERVGFQAAAVLSSLLYAGCHFRVNGFGPAAFVGLVFLGLLLAGFVKRTGGLWVSIGFHSTWNITQSGVFGLSMLDGGRHGKALVALQQRGPTALVGAGSLPEGGLVMIAILAVSAVLVLRYGERRQALAPSRGPRSGAPEVHGS